MSLVLKTGAIPLYGCSTVHIPPLLHQRTVCLRLIKLSWWRAGGEIIVVGTGYFIESTHKINAFGFSK